MNTDLLRRDESSVKSNVEKIRSELHVLEGQSEELDAMWDGAGSEVFKAQFHSDLDVLRQVIKELDKIYRFEEKSEKRFERYGRRVSDAVAEV